MPGSSIDKEGEAGACELGIRYPTLQAIYAGKINKQSIQVISTYDIIYNIICSYMISLLISHTYMISLLISHMFQVQGKKTYAGQTASAAYHHFTGVLGRASSQASSCGYPSRATKSFVQ